MIAQLVDPGLIGRGYALQPLQVDRIGANLLRGLALFTHHPLEAHHDRRALGIEGIEQAHEQELSGRNFGRRAGQKLLDVLFGLLEGSPPCRKFRHQRADPGVILPFVLDVIKRRAGPHGGHRDLRNLGLRAWPIGIAGSGREAARGRGRHPEQRARDHSPIHVSPPAAPRRLEPRDTSYVRTVPMMKAAVSPICIGHCHRGDIAMPHGSSPTWIVLTTFCAATSMTETSLETPLVARRYFSSGVNAMCQTRCPTSKYFVAL